MSEEKEKNLTIPTKSAYTKIEVYDPVGYFISYWNLAIKKLLIDNNCKFTLEKNISIDLPLNSFNINLTNIYNTTIENTDPLLFEDKLFTITVNYLATEKDLNFEFYQEVKQSYLSKNINLILISISEIKEDSNILKDCTKIMNKIKKQTGINDLTFLPYNIVFFEKLQNYFSEFLNIFSEKFSKEYLNKLNILRKKFNSYERNENEDYKNYQYIEELICYFDLLSLCESWSVIQTHCKKNLFKELSCLNNKDNEKDNDLIKSMNFYEYDVNKFKINFKNKILNNIEFQEYLFYYYIKTNQYLKDYQEIFKFINSIPYKMNLLIKNFKTEFHFIHWIINYFYGLIQYFNSLKKFLSSTSQKTINEGLVYLYSIPIKYFKLYSSKSKHIYIPNKKILIELINCIKNKDCSKIEERMVKLIDMQKEEDNNDLKLFKDDFKDNNNDKLFLIFNDNKKFLEEILSLLNNVNKNYKDFIKYNISIKCVFDIVYILIFFCRFNEAKNLLEPLLHYKFLKDNKIKYIYEYICFILLLVLRFIDKNNESLNLVFKLLNIKYSTTDKILQNLGCDNKNMINEIINDYLESFDLNKIENKNEINFSLDNSLNIKLFNGEDKIIFVNKSKNEKKKLEYKITNNTGIELNIDKINLSFEENNINDYSEKKNIIIYTIESDKNSFKKLNSLMKEKDEIMEIECNDIFKANNVYKLVEIQYIMNNSLKGIYHVKEKVELIFSELNLSVKTEIYPSYDSPNIDNNNYYYNILSMIKINIPEISDISELKNRSLIIEIKDLTKNNNDSILKIQTELFKSILKSKIPEIIVNDLSIIFPPDSIHNIIDIINLQIPFFYENTNYYTNIENKIEIKLNVKEKKENNDIILFSYSTVYKMKFTHLFTIGKRFKLLKNNSFLLQTFLSLNIENKKVKVYNLNNVINIDSNQAINMILVLSGKENDILLKLRNNFISFSLNDENDFKYRFCYPEKNILDEIKEIKEIPYHIIISVDKKNNDMKFDLSNEIKVNICIKKYKEKRVKLMIKINDNNNWCVIGKNKIIEEFGNEKSEKDINIVLLPLIDGFLQLPEIEFSEYEFDSDLKIEGDVKKENNDDISYEFEPIEYGTIIEGTKNVLEISPLKEYSLKINLT